MIDITAGIPWSTDCGGKEDLDFSIVTCDTRYWPDNSCMCHIRLCYDCYCAYYCGEHRAGIILVESDIMHFNSKEECQQGARDWYNNHILRAMKDAIDLINNGTTDMLKIHPLSKEDVEHSGYHY